MMRALQFKGSDLPSQKPSPKHRLFLQIGFWALVGLGLVLRLIPINQYVTPDEPAWIYRSIRFADAVTAHDWAAIPVPGHPGVTTMWLGFVGVTVQRWLAPVESTTHLDWIRRLAWLAPENGAAFRHLAFFLPAGRIVVALVTTLGLIVLFRLLVRLFDRRVAVMTIGLLTLDPSLIGYSGLLHTDAILATLSILTIITSCTALREPNRPAWAAFSGLFLGLALLTKTSALILVPFTLLILAISQLRPSPTKDFRYQVRRLPSIIGRWTLTLSIALLTCLSFYPALWHNPIGTLNTVFSFTGKLVETAPRPVFFAGQMTYDPGPAFYPVVCLFRISPAVMCGLALGLTVLYRLPPERRFISLLLLGYAVCFGVMISLGAKKHDRYLLPALSSLAIPAGLALSHFSVRTATTHVQTIWKTRPIWSLLVTLLLGTQFVLFLPFITHPLTFFNPLAGGPWLAAHVLSPDWGEGMGAAARWLNQLPEANQLTVAALSVPSFASVFEGYTVHLDQATQADYIVVGPDPSMSRLSGLLSGNPAYLSRIGFLNHAAVYTNTAPAEQAIYLRGRVKPHDLVIIDSNTPLLRHSFVSGATISTADLPDPSSIAASVVESTQGESNLWLVADPSAAPITAMRTRQVLETIATPVSTATVAGSMILRYTNTHSQEITIHPRLSTFGDHLILIDAHTPPEPVNAAFPVLLRWQVSTPPPTDLRASLRLKDGNGHLWAEVGELVLNDVDFPTSFWNPGQWTDDVLTMPLPDHIPPGMYDVEITVATVANDAGAQLGAWDADGRFRGVNIPLRSVEIAPPDEPVLLPVCEDGHILVAGPFLGCLPESSSPSIPSGDTLTLATKWSATEPPGVDYRARIRLLDATAIPVLEQMVDLCPYATSNWRKGDTFEARYDVRLAPALPASTYTLTLNILTPNDQPLWDGDEVIMGIEVLPRERLFQMPADIDYPFHLTLGNGAHLRGFDLNSTHIAPGDTLPLTLYWQASGPTDLSYTVFVHLVGPDGLLYGQADQIPGGGSAPTTSWAPDQVIIDKIRLPVGPNTAGGAYSIAFGMYDAISGARTPIVDDSDRLLPHDQAILPIEITVAGDSE
jgi:hypothetical protein